MIRDAIANKAELPAPETVQAVLLASERTSSAEIPRRTAKSSLLRRTIRDHLKQTSPTSYPNAAEYCPRSAFLANFRIADYPEVMMIGPLRVHATERHHPLLQTVVRK